MKHQVGNLKVKQLSNGPKTMLKTAVDPKEKSVKISLKRSKCDPTTLCQKKYLFKGFKCITCICIKG